ncbi:MAG: hypothetical protein BGO69_18415 [Bacteroidetes bacterium 46-16]|nr:MAG: hypothetical protein BGO69_18415 [Bacteroidetes bacterium 46-16]
MRAFLKLSSLLLFLFTACKAPYYARLVQQNNTGKSAFKYKAGFDKQLYRCIVDGRAVFKKFHLSGVLFFKQLDDGSTRAIFQNEMGFTFFDFEWSKNDSFKVNTIIPQLDKPAVIKTLEKDLNLLLMKRLDVASETVYKSGDETYYRFSLEKGYAYYVEKSARLMRIDNTGDKRLVTEILLNGKNGPHELPDSVLFRHLKANFTIELNKIASHADE